MEFGTRPAGGQDSHSTDLFPDEAAFLSEIIETQSDVAAVELDLQTIMQMVAERTQRLTAADGASVQLVEADHLVCRATSGIMTIHVGMRLALNGSLAGYAARTGKHEYCADTEKDPRVDLATTRRVGIRSLIVVPICHGAQVVGILNVSSGRTRAFRPRHVSALRLMAGLVAAAFGHAAEFEAKKALLAERTNALSALADSEERFRSAFDHAAIGMAIVALDGRWLQVNSSLCQIVGYNERELLARDFQSITYPDDLDTDLAHVRRLIAGEVTDYQMVKRYIHHRGHLVWVLLSVSLVRDAAGKPLHFISQIQDVSERKLAEQLERDRRQALEMVAQDMPLPDVLERLAMAIDRQMTGSTAAVIVLQDGAMHLHGPGVPAEWRDAMVTNSLTLAAGLARSVWDAPDHCGVTFAGQDEVWKTLRPIAARIGIGACWTMAIQSAESLPMGLLSVFCRESRRPTTAETHTLGMAAKLATICIEHHNTTKQLSHLVRHDPLTALPNRVMFDDRLRHALNLAARSGKHAGLLVLDIDKFKSVNDSFGHHIGDHLLQQFAQRLRSQLRQTDTMARLGGDEFAVVLPELTARDDAAVVARKLVECLLEPFEIGGKCIGATTSIGISVFPEDGRDAVTLQKQADDALYRVKARGRNSFGY